MTTIAINDFTIAADSQSEGTFIIQGAERKIFRIREAVVACCGNSDDAHEFMTWWECHYGETWSDERYPKVSDNFAALVWTPEEDQPRVFWGKPFGITMAVPFAMGSGAQYAMGAMLAGASPEEAVRIAMRLDPHTGGDVHVMALNHG